MLNNRSVTLLQLLRADEALQSCERAIAARPGYTDALYNRGNALLALGRLENARASFIEALSIDPARLDALNNLGLALTGLKRSAEALDSYERALAIDPEHLGALYNRANALTELARFAEALAACEKVLTKAPRHVDALNSAGVALGKLGRHHEALGRYDQALAVAPERLDIELNRGTSLLELDRIDEAISIFDAVLARDPGNLGALVNCGNACIRGKRVAEALASYDRALAINPAHAGALTDRGVALAEMGRFEEALACHDHALRIEPDLVAAHVNRGNALVMLARMAEALSSYDRAVALDVDNVEANFNAAVTRLCVGDYAAGWKQYERRWKKKHLAPHQRRFPQPMWRAEGDLGGKTILLHAEQGFGDTLSAVRYAPLVAGLGARVVLGVQPALKALMASVPGVAAVVADGEPLPAFDLHCPLMSLPLAFKTELDTVPANIPYLRAHPQRIAKWRERLPENGRLRVGLCWAGNPEQTNDRNRSMPLERLMRVVYVPGLDFVSLQKEVSLADKAMLREHGIARLGQDFKDFSDTAAVIAMLDLVVTVDTSVAHLAGAMGKAVAVLVCFSPDFRLMLERTDCPWYPTMRLFRQTAIGDWNDPVERLCGELVKVGQRAVKPRPAA